MYFNEYNDLILSRVKMRLDIFVPTHKLYILFIIIKNGHFPANSYLDLIITNDSNLD